MTKSKKRPTITRSSNTTVLEQTVLQPTVVDNHEQSNTTINVCDTINKPLVPVKTPKPRASKKSKKKTELNSTDIISSENTDTLQAHIPIANIIMHLKCSLNDLESYHDESNKHISDPLTYNPNVPPDIMTYHQAEQYSVFDASNTSHSDPTQEDFAYLESKQRCTPSSINAKVEISETDNNNTSENEYTTNMKEINSKLKKLKLSLFKNMTLVEKKSACFWCTYEFDNTECYIPRYDMDGTMYGYGCFCRPECAAAFLMKENLDDSTKFERYHLLNRIYSKIFNYKKNIKPAPNPYYLLDKY